MELQTEKETQPRKKISKLEMLLIGTGLVGACVLGGYLGNEVAKRLVCVSAFFEGVSCEQYQSQVNVRRELEFFKLYDLNGDGSVTREEYKGVF
ncbi:hypothetical protein HYX13_01830 [Candidatus Woesearchaeota archaeon]|nr:hypothetical protein [Candidatus Woesearchaeota archaeon]